MKRKALILTTIIIVLVNFASISRAGDDDTHYILVYLCARQVGFNEKDAQQIASATVSIDYDRHTEPVQKYKPWRNDPVARGIRRSFHAMLNTDIKGNNPEETLRLQLKSMERQSQRLYEEAKKTGNIGPYLHFLQDSVAHRDENGKPYKDNHGHLLDAHFPDYLGNDIERAKEVTKVTIDALSKFKRDRGEEPRPVNQALMDKWVEVLVRTNNPNALGALKVGGAPLPVPVVQGVTNAPDKDRARKALEEAMREQPADRDLSDLYNIPPETHYPYSTKLRKQCLSLQNGNCVPVGLPQPKNGGDISGNIDGSTEEARERNELLQVKSLVDKGAISRDSLSPRMRTELEQFELNQKLIGSSVKTGRAPSGTGITIIDPDKGAYDLADVPEINPQFIEALRRERQLLSQGRISEAAMANRTPGGGYITIFKTPSSNKPSSMREFLTTNQALHNQILSNRLPPESGSKPIIITDGKVNNRTQIPYGWVPCSCPGDHAGLGIWFEGTMYHDPAYICP